MKRIPPEWQPTIEFAGCLLLAAILYTEVAGRMDDVEQMNMAVEWVNGINDNVTTSKQEILDRLDSLLGETRTHGATDE